MRKIIVVAVLVATVFSATVAATVAAADNGRRFTPPGCKARTVEWAKKHDMAWLTRVSAVNPATGRWFTRKLWSLPGFESPGEVRTVGVGTECRPWEIRWLGVAVKTASGGRFGASASESCIALNVDSQTLTVTCGSTSSTITAPRGADGAASTVPGPAGAGCTTAQGSSPQSIVVTCGSSTSTLTAPPAGAQCSPTMTAEPLEDGHQRITLLWCGQTYGQFVGDPVKHLG